MKEPKHPKPGMGADPSMPKRRKAKELRKEKAIQKMTLTGRWFSRFSLLVKAS